MRKPKPKRKAVAKSKTPRLSTTKAEYFDKLYLMERVSEKSAWSRLWGLSEIKIGVTGVTVEGRRFDVDTSLRGDIIIIREVYKPGKVYREEDRLHRKWSDKNWRPKVQGPSAGPTEWFRVDWLTYSFILLDFWEFRNRERLQLLYFSIFLIYCAWVWLENRF